jgi:hypothetical protein
MTKKQKLANHKFNEKIVYWKWASDTILAIVTKTSVYHINITDGSMKKHFDRKGAIAGKV